MLGVICLPWPWPAGRAASAGGHASNAGTLQDVSGASARQNGCGAAWPFANSETADGFLMHQFEQSESEKTLLQVQLTSLQCPLRTWISCRRSGDRSAKASPADSAAGDPASRAGEISSTTLFSVLAGAAAAALPSLGPASAASLLLRAAAAAARRARRSAARRAAVCVLISIPVS